MYLIVFKVKLLDYFRKKTIDAKFYGNCRFRHVCQSFFLDAMVT